MKLKAFQGQTQITDFEDLFTDDHVIDWIKSRLADGAIQWKVRKKRNNETESRGTLLHLDDKNNYLLKSGEFYYIKTSDKQQALSNFDNIIQYLYDDYYFQICNDDDTNATGQYGETILDELTIPNFTSIISMRPGQMDQPQTLKDLLFSKEIAGIKDYYGNTKYKDVFVPKFPVYIDESNKSSNQELVELITPEVISVYKHVIWIPNVIPIVFTPNTNVLYKQANNKWNHERLKAGQLPYYIICKGTLTSGQFVKKKGYWPPTGRGSAGGGAGRSDLIEEVVCSISDGTGVVGGALGLTNTPITNSLKTLEFTAWPWTDGGKTITSKTVTYSKSFKTGLGNGKKNLPKATLPLVRAAATDSRFLTKKKKGGAFALKDGKQGETVQSPETARGGTGSVMKDDLKERIDGDHELKKEIGGDRWQGSATELAKAVLKTDAVMRAYWTGQSADLKNQDGTDAKYADKGEIRTDQEWCHLFGHAIGGEEEASNFVSGSKHCNTEQLAIEMAVKDWEGKFSIKVSAYLMPQKPRVNKVAAEELKKEFHGIFHNSGEPEAAFDETKKASDVSEMDFYTKQMETFRNTMFDFFAIYCANESTGTTINICGTDITIPTKERYNEENSTRKTKICRTLADHTCSALFFIYPIADWIRYKVYLNKKKIIDYTMDAQKEAFDYNEYRLLSMYCNFKIAEALGKQTLKKFEAAIVNKMNARGK